MEDIQNHNDQKSKERRARLMFEQMVSEIPGWQLWPVVVGLLQHLLLGENTPYDNYTYGVFAVTDTLRDAAILQQQLGQAVEADIQLFSMLRKSHML